MQKASLLTRVPSMCMGAFRSASLLTAFCSAQMVYQLIGTRGQAIAWRNPEKLRQALGFADGDEMKNYMTDDHGRFLPYFMEYAEKWIWPAQKDANEKGTSRQRGVGIDLVEACLIAGESLGNEKFSGEEELGSRKDWQQVDHLALLLYKLRKANTKSTKGLFFGKGLSDTIINDQLWALIKHAEYHLAPARVIKKPMSQKSKGKQPEKSDSSSRTSQPFANATERFIKVFGRRNLEETDADVSPKGSPAPSDENIEAIVGNIRVRFDDDEPAMPPAVNDDDLELTLGSSKQLTNAQRMALECNTDRFDIDYRFWVCWLINTALRDDAQWSQTKKDIEWVTQDLHHVADAESQAWFKTVATGMDQDYVTLQPFDEDLVAEFDRQQQFVDSESYQREDLGASCELLQIKWRGLENTVYRIAGMALSQTMCFWQPVAVKALHDFSMDPTIQGCILADVMGLGKTWVVVVYLIWVSSAKDPSAKDPCAKGLYGKGLYGKGLCHWKSFAEGPYEEVSSIGIRSEAFGNAERRRDTRLICNQVLKRRPFTTMQHEPRPMARPTLILVPKALINQWMKQIQMIAPGQFDVRKYHGDTRRHRPVVAEMTIDEHLTKSNVIFDGREERASIIVISSFTTWAYRHGPKAQHKWRLDNGWTRTSTDRAFIELDREWPGSLSHCFNIAVADEAQSLKSLTSHGNYALRWLSTSFNILATGTPIPNGPDDIKGLLPFLERPESESWWTPAILKDMGVDSKVNPYSLSDDHPAARLRITARAVDYWIHSSRWSSVEKGQRIHQIWKRCMIRRTHSSMIPFKTGRVIGDQLPKIQAIFVHCNHTPQEKTDYKEQEDAITGKLFASDVGKPKKQKITLGVIRKLTMLTLWTELPAIDEIYGLKAADIKIAMAKDRYYMEWFDKPCTTKLTVAIRVTLLKRMLKGAPKMRALLQNLTSQVSIFTSLIAKGPLLLPGGVAEGFDIYLAPM